MTAANIFQFHELTTDRVNASLLHEISPTILYTAQTMNCDEKQQSLIKPKAAEGKNVILISFNLHLITFSIYFTLKQS